MKRPITNTTKVLCLFALIGMLGIGCSGESGSTKPAPQSIAASKAGQPVEESEGPAEYGVGPVKHVELAAEIDLALAEKGKNVFETNCTACHKFGERYVGPDLKGVTERRNPAWIMNMIMNPTEMTQKDPIAKQLLGEYLAQMADQNISEPDARAIVEYFRQHP